MVYVLSIEGKPLMPCKEAKARHLLKQNRARVVKISPFTIQLLFECENKTQEITLGVDAGSKTLGLSATTEDKVLYEANVELRNDVVDLLSSRREARRTRRSRKTRYRKARFNNRTKSKPSGWVAPSVQQKIDTHMSSVVNVYRILPVSKIVVEVASFDIQKIKNPDIGGVEYQQGEQLGFWNVREYVLWRDNHTCQCCKGKSKDKILNVHHIESRKVGGNAPNNLVTLCEYCHTQYHMGNIELPQRIKRGQSHRDSTFMGIMRWGFYSKLKEIYPDVSLTYGYITKSTRIENNLSKDHYIDARCISGNPLAKSDGNVFYIKKVRRHNRKLYKDKTLSGNKRKVNQCQYTVLGFHRFDLVKYDNRLCYISSLRTKGYFMLKDLTDKEFVKEVSPKKITKFQSRSGYVTEMVKVC